VRDERRGEERGGEREMRERRAEKNRRVLSE
jgi:hypothetical protein